MSEKTFFTQYSTNKSPIKIHCISQYIKEQEKALASIPEIPFSKVWVASQLLPKIPANSFIHFSILGSFRASNFFQLPESVQSSCNVGGFGIDGATSTVLGASLINKEKLHYLMTGDLAFFYDLNAIGNRHLSNNVRILLVNNGNGTEFRMHWHPCSAFTKDECDKYMAAGGHYGNKSSKFVRHMAEDLGFEYLCASTKEEFNSVLPRFTELTCTPKPILLEVFTDSETDSNVVDQMRHLLKDSGYAARKGKQKIKETIKTIIGDKTYDLLKQKLN